MGTTKSEDDRCWEMLTILNTELAWGLDTATLALYAQPLKSIVLPMHLDAELRRVACNYHADHALVEALLQREHAQHTAMWQRWAGLAQPIVRRAGLIWEFDSAVSIEDLVQIASMELARSLPTYQYSSRFSTWAHQVVVRSVQRYLRSLRAQKRRYFATAIYPELLYSPQHLEPEIYSQGSAFFALVHSLLQAQPDKRIVHIFYLWAVEDRRLIDIGQHIGLSESRVRVLLNQSLRILASTPAIRNWAAAESGLSSIQPESHRRLP